MKSPEKLKLLVKSHKDNSSLFATCTIPADLPCFDGHFPGNPIVPGVVQLNWLLDLTSELAGAKKEWKVQNLKFKKELAPGDDIIITISRHKDTWNASIKIKDTPCTEAIIS